MKASICHLTVLGFTLLAGACGGDDGGGTDAGAADGTSIDGPPIADAGPADANLLADRPFGFKVPSGYDPATPTPLVVSLHGYSSNGQQQVTYWRLAELADVETFLLAYPDGTVDQDGNRFWSATPACCDFYGVGVDDVAYVTAIIDDVQAHYNVDPQRIYVIGHSNGGFMSHRLACELAPRLAGIVSLAGSTFKLPAQCAASAPVAVLQVHGDMDETIAYAGSGGFPSAPETVAMWAATNGCTGGLEAAGTADLVGNLAGAETRIERHAGCAAGAAELWTIEGGTHVPAFNVDWAPAFYAFLKAHPKP